MRSGCAGCEGQKDGPACHTGAESCFNEVLYGEDTQATIDTLYELIKGRKEIPQEGSYTSYLFEKGIEKILKKLEKNQRKS